MKWLLLPTPLYRWENQGIESLSSLLMLVFAPRPSSAKFPALRLRLLAKWEKTEWNFMLSCLGGKAKSNLSKLIKPRQGLTGKAETFYQIVDFLS